MQTASWLFTGEVEHRDTTGTHALVRPGQLNLMTAGSGIAHSEYSTPATTVLHGAQLWIALPEADRFAAPGFAHYEPPVTDVDGAKVLVFLGSLFGQTSPVPTYSALVGAEVTLSDPNRILLPESKVVAVVHEPGGSLPAPLQGFWGRHHEAYREYAERSRTPEGFQAWLEEWVLGVPDRAAYLGKLGGSAPRISRSLPSTTVDYGYE